MRFTDSPYEDFMKEKSYFKGVPPNLPPKGSRCDGCLYWHGIGCVFCYREQLRVKTGGKMSRELTRQEKAAIRSLVKRWCANYDKDIGCLPLDCECYMLGKCWTGTYCRYFRSAVLPLDPVLERSLTVETVAETRPCPVCGRAFLPDGRQRYCSPACAGAARRQKQRGYMRKYRGRP